jgi:hypothetical protein
MVLEAVSEEKESQKWLANYLEIKPKRFRQLYSIYKQTSKLPDVKSKVGRPKKPVPTLSVIARKFNSKVTLLHVAEAKLANLEPEAVRNISEKILGDAATEIKGVEIDKKT